MAALEQFALITVVSSEFCAICAYYSSCSIMLSNSVQKSFIFRMKYDRVPKMYKNMTGKLGIRDFG